MNEIYNAWKDIHGIIFLHTLHIYKYLFRMVMFVGLGLIHHRLLEFVHETLGVKLERNKGSIKDLVLFGRL